MDTARSDAATTDPAGLQVRRVPLDSLHLDPANARAHGEENLDAIEASLRRFGQAEPLVVQASTGKIIGGNGRFVAMKKLGWTECDVVQLDVDEGTATALGIALNRTGELAEWDDQVLAKLLQQLREEGALDGVGFDDDEIDELLESLEADDDSDGPEDDGPGAMPVAPVSRSGDVWVLGEHRLLCGDSREAASYDALLGEETAGLVWTDPPYGVSYSGGTAEALTIQNDDAEGLGDLLDLALANAASASRPGACWYVAAPAGPQFAEFARVLSKLGIWRQTLAWVKDAFVLGHSDFHYRHEALFYGWTPGAAHQEPPTRDLDTIWEVDRPKASPDHPTTKPVELITRALRASSKVNDVVLDPFSGSGSTIIAAESTKRRARAIEVDPRYVDVAVRRWEDATRRQAVLEADGRTFDDVAQERLAE